MLDPKVIISAGCVGCIVCFSCRNTEGEDSWTVLALTAVAIMKG